MVTSGGGGGKRVVFWGGRGMRSEMNFLCALFMLRMTRISQIFGLSTEFAFSTLRISAKTEILSKYCWGISSICTEYRIF